MSEVKYCKECQWYEGEEICDHPDNMKTSLVTGLMFPIQTATALRSDAEYCGPSAKWFE